MARTVFFSDGSHEVLFSGEDTDKMETDLERILRERLGADTVELFHDVLADTKRDLADTESDRKSYEMSCDNYRACLCDVKEILDEAAELLLENRIDRKKINAALRRAYTRINNEL